MLPPWHSSTAIGRQAIRVPRWLHLALLVLMTLLTPTTAPAQGGMELDTNRQGGDYRSFDLPAADPALCRDACIAEGRC